MLNSNRKTAWLAASVLAVYWTALFIATHWPRLSLPPVAHGDKIAHFVAYAGLAFLMSWALMLRWRNWMLVVPVVLGIATIYGALDETLQLFVPGRHADVLDWFADVAGSLIGVVAFLLVYAFTPLARDVSSPETVERISVRS